MESTETSTEAMAEEMVPLWEEIKNLNKNVPAATQQKWKTRKREFDESSRLNAVEQYNAADDETKLINTLAFIHNIWWVIRK